MCRTLISSTFKNIGTEFGTKIKKVKTQKLGSSYFIGLFLTITGTTPPVVWLVLTTEVS